MNTERWNKIRALFDAAVKLERGEREPFLAAQCRGDAELASEVRSLLVHDDSSDAVGMLVHETQLDVGRMTLDVGDGVGGFEVTGVIGAGGMGEVYRARDTSLDRDVALKIIPAVFANDRVRLARFEREAKVLASLSHPNIASIYGFEKQSGAPALVLELVDGETLAEIIARGPLPLGDALSIAGQLAAALDVAHERGVVHRDLKPANIKVTRDGVAKVLDFGLAKLLEADPPGAASLTKPGGDSVLGTAAYMSPEQARGAAVDKRTDIWSFGAVLFEMLTGQRLFPGDNVSDTLVAVLRDEIVLTSLPADTPAGVTRLLARCLEREPKRRLRDIGDSRLEIDEALHPKAAAEASVRARAVPLFALFASVLTLCVLAFAGWRLGMRARDASPPVSRFTVALPDGVSMARTADVLGNSVALSPDGRTIAFAAMSPGGRVIYLRALDRLDAHPLAGTDGGHTPFFSPDGNWVGFLSGTAASDDGALKKVRVTGGAPVVVTEGHFEGASWGGDDEIVLGSRQGLVVVPAGGGDPVPMFPLDEAEWHRGPRFLPGGDAVLYYVWTGTPDSTHIDVAYLSTGERHVLTEGTAPEFASSGHLVFARAGAVWAAPFEVGDAALGSEPVRVLDELDVSLGGFAAFDLADDGSLVYAPIPGAPERALMWVDLDGNETTVDIPVRDYNSPRVSPDGTRISVSLGEVDSDVWLYDVARSMLTRFTADSSSDSDAEWSPDGDRIAFHSHRDGGGDIHIKAADGTGTAERMTSGPGEKLVTSWTPDGKFLVLSERRDNATRVLTRTAADGRNVVELLRRPANLSAATVSPDGRFIAYVSDESGVAEVYARPYPDVDRARWQVSPDGGRAPVWRQDGRAIYYRHAAEVRQVSVNTESGFVVGKAETLFTGSYVLGGVTDRSYDLAPDGRFLMLKDASMDSDDASRTRLVLVHNWTEELDAVFERRR